MPLLLDAVRAYHSFPAFHIALSSLFLSPLPFLSLTSPSVCSLQIILHLNLLLARFLGPCVSALKSCSSQLWCPSWGVQVGVSKLGCPNANSHTQVGVSKLGCPSWGVQVGVSSWGDQVEILFISVGVSKLGCPSWGIQVGVCEQ